MEVQRLPHLRILIAPCVPCLAPNQRGQLRTRGLQLAGSVAGSRRPPCLVEQKASLLSRSQGVSWMQKLFTDVKILTGFPKSQTQRDLLSWCEQVVLRQRHCSELLRT